MSRIVCLLEPSGEAADFLIDAKATAIQQTSDPLPYVDHPPHCTLVVGPFGDPENWRASLEAALALLRPFPITAQGWRVFEQDALAGGGDTLALDISTTPALLQLQYTVAEMARAGLTEASDASELPEALQHGPFLDSWNRYGFPFVGSHWLPHATVASFPASERPLLERLRAEEPSFTWTVEEVTVMRVEGDDHALCFRVPLGGGEATS